MWSQPANWEEAAHPIGSDAWIFHSTIFIGYITVDLDWFLINGRDSWLSLAMELAHLAIEECWNSLCLCAPELTWVQVAISLILPVYLFSTRSPTKGGWGVVLRREILSRGGNKWGYEWNNRLGPLINTTIGQAKAMMDPRGMFSPIFPESSFGGGKGRVGGDGSNHRRCSRCEIKKFYWHINRCCCGSQFYLWSCEWNWTLRCDLISDS